MKLDKIELFNSLKTEFELLYPDIEFTIGTYEIMCSMVTVDLMIFKGQEISYYEFLWRKTFCWLYTINFSGDTLKRISKHLDKSFYDKLYMESTLKIESINFKC